eukprot:g30945.t1
MARNIYATKYQKSLDVIYTTTKTPKAKFPEALFIVASDFNHANLKRAMPKYHQYISCPTRGLNILDDCYTTIKDTYCSIPCSRFGKSDYSAMQRPTFFKKTTTILIPRKAHAVCLNDYCTVALTSIIMKCFERPLMAQINSSLPACLNPLQFAYRCNRSMVDTISLALHSSQEHLDNKGTYVRLLFIDYSSTFNTIIPSRLISKLCDLGLSSSLCNWILILLTHRPQTVRIGNCTSSTITLNIGVPPPQGCILSPLLYSLYTHNCVAKFQMRVMYKFADDTTVVRQIANNDESKYRREIEGPVMWCNENSLSLNVGKTKELIIYFRKKGGEHASIYIKRTEVERVECIKFLREMITDNLSWTSHINVTVKKAQRCLFFLTQLRKFGMSKYSAVAQWLALLPHSARDPGSVPASG